MITNFDICYGCDKPLAKSARQRVNPCLCAGCGGKRGNRVGPDPVKAICNKLRKSSKPLTKEELLIERAAWESLNFRVDDEDLVIG
tara:strand:- start:522 stop:779 length:258 start_codon:yes stop_codon:yes gene_type:complete